MKSDPGRRPERLTRALLGAALMIPLLALGTGCAVLRPNVPTYQQVPAGQPMAIDGLYRLEETGKRYRIRAGRSWLEDPSPVGPVNWLPGDVIAIGIEQTGPTTYTGRDLALSGPWVGEVSAEGIASTVTVAGIPTHWTLVPIELDHPGWSEAQLGSSSVLPPPHGLASNVAPAPRASGGSALGASSLAPSEPALPGNVLGDLSAFGGYHALVIGNNGYTDLPRLVTAINDAEAVGRVLRERYGFQVTTLKDATRAEILTQLRAMRETLTDQDNLLIYYAGHGWLDKDADEGYWLPVDAEEDSDINWISNATITGYLRSIRAKHVMVVADSCYSGTLTRGIKLDVRPPDYLDRMARMRARIVLSSGGLEPVTDGGGGGHSAFANSFLNELKSNPGVLDSTTLYSRIRRPVMLAADQAPELADIRKAGHEGGDFLFIPRDGK